MPAVPPWFALTAVGVLGLIFGSFANVVIWRLPRGESLSSPPSHCPHCGHAVRWYDNVPVVSWLVLGGRCRDCKEPIPWRYPAVEALSGILWVAAAAAFGWTLQTVWAIAMFYLLLILAFIDLDLRRLPNVLVAILAAIGLAGAVVWQLTGIPAAPLVGASGDRIWGQPLVAAILGAALGAGVSLAISLIYGLIRRRQGLGMGDVKLLGAMGLFLGPYVLLAYLLGTLAGAVAGIAAIASARVTKDAPRSATKGAAARGKAAVGASAKASASGGSSSGAASIPFGPWLALGAVVTALWGPAIWGSYLHLAGLA